MKTIKKPRQHQLLALGLLTLAFSRSAPAFAQSNQSTTFGQWSNEFVSSLGQLRDQASLQITQAIFDSVSSLDLVQIPIGSDSLTLHSSRTLYDNYDLRNTWSVVDLFRIESSIPILSVGPDIPIGADATLSLRFYIGGRAGIQFVDVRQVSAHKEKTDAELLKELPQYSELPSISEDHRKLESSDWYQQQEDLETEAKTDPDLKSISTSLSPESHLTKRQYRKQMKKAMAALSSDLSSEPTLNDPNITELEVKQPNYFLDPSTYPRFAKILNRVTFPARLPLSSEAFQKLADFELVAYTGYGAIEIGANALFSVSPIPLVANVHYGFNQHFYIRDDFTITVLKENNHVAQVKLTKTLAKGSSRSHQISIQSKPIIEGFAVLETIEFSPLNVTLVPFSISTDKSASKIYDLTYRYNMDTEQGREAYDQAVKGRFALSQSLSEKPLSPSEIWTVTKIERSVANKTSESHRHDFNFAWLITLSRGRTIDSVNLAADLPDGKHKIFRETNQTIRQRNILFDSFETTRRSFTVTVDQDHFALGGSQALTLLAETSISDSNTKPGEMVQYINDAQETVGKNDIFPALPSTAPTNGLGKKMKRFHFGHSSFNFGYQLNRPQIERLLNAPDEIKRNAILTVFKADPLYCEEEHADRDTLVPSRAVCRFYTEWHPFTPIQTPQERVQALTHWLEDKRLSREFMKVIQISVHDQKNIDFFLTAENSSFGRIQYHSKPITQADEVLNATENQTHYELLPRQLVLDNKAKVLELGGKVGPHRVVKIEFKLAYSPKWVYFTFTRLNGWRHSTVTGKLRRVNADEIFKVGNNSLQIDPLAPTELGRTLAKYLKEDGRYTLDFGYSRDANHWGPGLSTNFEIKKEPLSRPIAAD